MQIDLSGKRLAKYEPVTIGEESFEVEVSEPRFADRLADEELLGFGQRDGRWIEHRLKTAITGWRGLESSADAGPIEFNQENLQALCQQFPKVFDQLVTLAHRAYQSLSEDAKKN